MFKNDLDVYSALYFNALPTENLVRKLVKTIFNVSNMIQLILFEKWLKVQRFVFILFFEVLEANTASLYV